MNCNRLIALVKNWYMQVQNEAMAPARMVEFMTKHIATCEECAEDPDVRAEADKIREIVLPASKITKHAEAVDGRKKVHHAEAVQPPNAEEHAEDTDDGQQPAENGASEAV